MTKKKSNLLLSELMEEWLRELKPAIKISTYSTYAFYMQRYLQPYITDILASELSQTKLKALILTIQNQGRIHQENSLSASSMRLIYFILKAGIRYGVEQGMINAIPFPPLKSVRPQEKRLVMLHKKEQEHLESYILGHFNSMSAGTLLSLYTGLRIGELCALTWDQINLDEGFLTVNKTIQRIYLQDETAHSTKIVISEPKTQNAKREIPLSNQLIRLLRKLQPAQDNGVYFLTGIFEKYCEPRRYRNFFKNLLEAAGIIPVSFHACRHTFASRCIEIGIDVKTVSKLLGHSNVNLTLNRYVHSNLELQRKEMERLGNLLSI